MDIIEKDQMILENIPLVKKIASKIIIREEIDLEFEDIVGYGILGLIEAVEKYNTDKGTKFSTYAYKRIKGSILDEVRKLSPYSRNVMVDINSYNSAIDKLQKKLNRTPDINEIMEEMNVPKIKVLEIQNNIFKLIQENMEEKVLNIIDVQIEGFNEKLEKKEEKEYLIKLINNLKDKDKEVIIFYYYKNLNFKEIGNILGVSESRISQIHKRAISNLQQSMNQYNKEVK